MPAFKPKKVVERELVTGLVPAGDNVSQLVIGDRHLEEPEGFFVGRHSSLPARDVVIGYPEEGRV